LPGKKGKEISALALRQMDGNKVEITPSLKQALEDALEETTGTVSYINLIDKFHIPDKKKELLNLSIRHGNDGVGSASTDLLLKLGERKIIEGALKQNDSTAISLLHSLNGKGSQDCISLIVPVVLDSTRSLSVRQIAVQTLGSSWPGEEKLLSLVKSSKFPKDLKQPAASVLFNVYRSSIQREAAKYLSKPTVKGSSLPSTKQLLASTGNIQNGKIIFSKYCTTCHRVNDEGIKFGPELTQIGDKLSKEGIYRAILYPDEGVSFGYESTLITLKDGTQSMGIVASETDASVVLNLAGGSSVTFSRDQVKNKNNGNNSLMPPLANAMTTQELVDLVEYLSTLRK
jgi:putative heme-binding domain-containing protein